MSSPVTLPVQAVKVESGETDVVSLPEKCNRLVYCFSEKECYSCLASHVYQLCNLFDSPEFTTILLFCPPEAIYGLYYDCGAEELSERNPVIHVFSWDGELKAIYHLDEQLYSIAITEDGKTLYGLTEEEVLYKYVLN